MSIDNEMSHVHEMSKERETRVKEITFLGDSLSGRGARPSTEKGQAITNMPRPQSKEQVQRALGIFNNEEKFIPNLAGTTSNLRALLKDKSIRSNGHGKKAMRMSRRI